MRILIFGDSIVYGAWDDQGGWADRLKRDAHRTTLDSEGEKKRQVFNLGIGGDTSTKILKRLEFEATSRHSASWPFVFIFSFCANDERAMDGDSETPIDRFQENIREIVDIAKQYTDNMLFVGAPPLAKPTVIFKGAEYSQERIDQYEDVTWSVLKEKGIPYVKSADLLRESSGIHSYDGIHPNDKGHKIIYASVKAELEKLFKF